MTDMIDWDAVPDDELNETFLERIEGLKEILPRGMRQHGSSLFGWGWWITKGGVCNQSKSCRNRTKFS